MPTFTFFEEFGSELLKGTHNFHTGGNTFKFALANSLPSVDTADEVADVTQITGGSYAAATVANQAVAETAAGSGIWKYSGDDVVFTASAGDYGAARYAILYNDTSSGDKLVGYLDYGASFTVTSGNTFTIDVGTDGFFQFTIPAP
jgi:hypothetical protein